MDAEEQYLRNLLDRRLSAHVVKDESGCWLWRGKRDCYGRMKFRGRLAYTHRWAYELHVGPIPEGYEIDHLCCVPACCNPEHLEAVHPTTHRQRTKARIQP